MKIHNYEKPEHLKNDKGNKKCYYYKHTHMPNNI